jgi:glycosyltransferase involved in cell wall biosynthesis
MTEVKNYIANSHKKDYIKLLSKLPEKELFTYYKNAMALLIPLRPTFQDIARFPHKTGEYMASGNPVISTNYGEIKFYFRDNKDMLLADSYDVKLFADKMKFAIDNQEAIKQIGATGKIIASFLFDYKCKAKEIDNFLDQLS